MTFAPPRPQSVYGRPGAAHGIVADIDWGLATQVGRHYGEAFKNVGAMAGDVFEEKGRVLKENKLVKDKLEGIKGGLTLFEKSPLGENYKSEIDGLRTKLESPDLSDRAKVELGGTGIGVLLQMFGLEMRMPKTTGQDLYAQSLRGSSSSSSETAPPSQQTLASLGGDTPDVASPMPTQPPSQWQWQQDQRVRMGLPPKPLPESSDDETMPPEDMPDAERVRMGLQPKPLPESSDDKTAATIREVPSSGPPNPPPPLSPQMEHLLAFGRANPKALDSSLMPRYQLALKREDEIRNYPVELQDYNSKQLDIQKAKVALAQANLTLAEDKQPGMTKEKLKEEVSSLKEMFPDTKLNFNIFKPKGKEGYTLTVQATPKGPTLTKVTAETEDGDTVKLPLFTNGTDYFVVDRQATDPNDILKNIGDDPLKGLSAYSDDLTKSIKELRAQTAGVDEDGKPFTVGEFEDLTQILAANPNLMEASKNGEGNVVWELDVEGWDDDIEWVGAAKDRAIALQNDLKGRLKQLNEISVAYKEKSPLTRTPQATPTARPPTTPERAQFLINAGLYNPR